MVIHFTPALCIHKKILSKTNYIVYREGIQVIKTAVRFPLSAGRWSWSLSALRVILRDSEESPVDQPKGKPSYGQAKGQLWSTRAFSAECAQYAEIVTHWPVNTGPREDVKTVIRAVLPEARGFRRLRRPGSSRHGADALGGSGSAHRAGWFRGSYECCLRQRVPFGAGRGR